MSKVYESITPELVNWIEQQHLYFVATAPLSGDGLVNCSPKGMDSFRVLGPNQVAYLDLTGSGAETIAHLRENGRIVIMFCALSGLPQIVRLHGTGTVVTRQSPGYTDLAAQLPTHPGARGIILVDVQRISDSCGYGVPLYDYAGERDALNRWTDKRGPDGLVEYRQQHNRQSLDGLPGLSADET